MYICCKLQLFTMAFKKGQSGNPKGKPIGSKGTKTLEWEEFGKQLLENGLPRAIEILQTCDDEKFIAQFANLLEYFKPKLARVDTLQLPENTQPLNKIEIIDSTES